MRINVLQHAVNEGPGVIKDWADQKQTEFYVYHPAQFGILPTAAETDLLVILGGPMSPNDDFAWSRQERKLIKQLLAQNKPIFGACFGAQQLAQALGGQVKKAPHKEVGWAPVYLKGQRIPGLPEKIEALHVHQDMFTLPPKAELLFDSDLNTNQGFLLGQKVVGLQFHFEPDEDELREIMVNDGQYALDHNDLQQTPAEIIKHGVPQANRAIMYRILDFICGDENDD
jgi:GMP synthase-like glutamine amidotransferase